jgi:hypothetical protein
MDEFDLLTLYEDGWHSEKQGNLNTEYLSQILDRYSREGWQVVQISADAEGYMTEVLLKRAVQPA